MGSVEGSVKMGGGIGVRAGYVPGCCVAAVGLDIFSDGCSEGAAGCSDGMIVWSGAVAPRGGVAGLYVSANNGAGQTASVNTTAANGTIRLVRNQSIVE